MFTVISETQEVNVPEWVVDLESFRRWADADDFPDQYRVSFLQGRVWVDVSKEQVFTHTLVKTRVATALDQLTQSEDFGLYFGDGLLFSNEEANLSVKPDGTFISNESLDAGRVRLIEGMEDGHVEVEGSPDMVLEVVSDSSFRKDTVVLRQSYWEAGVREYWLVDARNEPIRFDILRRTSRGYSAAPKDKGWSRSGVFGKSFRLTKKTSARGHAEFVLSVR